MADETRPEGLRLRILDEEYPFPTFDTLSYKEARRIKKETDGLVMGQFFHALDQGDPDALFAVAVIAKLRHDPRFDVREFEDLKLSDIEIVAPELPEEEAASPASPLGDGGPGNEPANDGEAESSDETPSPTSNTGGTESATDGNPG